MPQTPPPLVLASASPARLDLLLRSGLTPTVLVSGVDEDALEAALGPSATPTDVALTLARAKAQAVASLPETSGSLILGCDSILEFEGQALGKPESPAEAISRWYAMRGRSGTLLTGHWLVDRSAPSSTPRETGKVAATVVHFANPSDEEILAYIATGEPLWVAGAFTIDGLGGIFVDSIEGDHSNVVGLSRPLLRRLVDQLGYNFTDYWTKRSESDSDPDPDSNSNSNSPT